MRHTIPEHLVYRIYGDALAVVMDVPAKRVVLLQKEALDAWRKAEAGAHLSPDEAGDPIYGRLADLGVVKIRDRSRRATPESQGTAASGNGVREVDLGVVNYWAFKNHIPISGHFELTELCNLRCRHCYGLFEKDRDALDTDTVRRILDELQQSGTLGLVLTGGEIFLRRDILDILSHLRERKFVLRINTNGTLIDEAMVRCLAPLDNIYRIHISLYGADPEVHDGIVNRGGAFHKTLRALHMLKEAGFDLRINCSVMRSNVDTYQEIHHRIGEPMGIPVHYDSTIYPKDDGSTDNLEEQIDDDQLRDFARFKARLAGNGKEWEAKNPAPKKPQRKLCKAAFSFFSICEDGSLYPCLKMKRLYRQPVGNLATESFGHIWKGSPKVLKIRNALDKKLRECDICDLSI